MRRGKLYAWVVLIGLVHLAVWGSDLRPVQAQTSCLFTPFADTLLYHAPILDLQNGRMRDANQVDGGSHLEAGRGLQTDRHAPAGIRRAIDQFQGLLCAIDLRFDLDQPAGQRFEVEARNHDRRHGREPGGRRGLCVGGNDPGFGRAAPPKTRSGPSRTRPSGVVPAHALVKSAG